MTSLAFAAQLSYASVDDGHGGDPRSRAREVLRELRVLAALRDADAEWSDADEEAVVVVAVTDDGEVLTLTDEGMIARTLTVAELRARFADERMTLWLEDPASDGTLADEYDYDVDDDPEEGFQEDADELDPEELAALFAEHPVQVREFSRRGPISGRVLATAAKAEIEYAEASDWSLLRYETAGTAGLWQPSKAESPAITVNLPRDGDVWIEVRTHGAFTRPMHFWPDAERDTVPVLDIDEIAVPAAAETYRMLLAEGDGVRDELEELADRCDLDVERAHEALKAEALGGVVGSEARIRAFLAAFDVPAELIDAALSDADELPGARRFAPRSWPQTAGDVIVGGTTEATALTRRDRPFARLARAVESTPALGVAVALGELALGVVLTTVLRRGWKAVGGLLIADAVTDLALLWRRTRR